MLTIAWLIAVTTVVLLLGTFFAEVVFKDRCGRQDAAWRYTLLAVALVPMVIVARGAFPKFELPVAFLAAKADAVASNTSNGSVAKPPDSGADNSIARDTRYLSTGGSNEPLKEKDPLRWRLDSDASSPVWRTATDTATEHALTTNGKEAESRDSKSIAMRLALVLWCGGALFSLGHLYVGWWRIRQISRGAAPVNSAAWRDAMQQASNRAGLSADKLQVCVSKQVSSPIAIGILSPQIVLPQTMVDDCSDPCAAHIVSILTHEAVHIRRRDPVWNLLLQLAAAVWWIHPLSRLMKRRLVWLRELLCDGVVAVTGNPERYAETLLEFAVNDASPGNVALAMQPPPGTLESRVRWILSQPSPVQLRPFRRSVAASILTVACCVALSVAVVQLVPSAVAEEAKKSPLPKETPPHLSGPDFQGVILTPDGKPAAGAKVYLRVNPDGSYTLPVKKETATTSDDGRFQFKSVKPGDYRVWAETEQLTTLEKKLNGRKIRISDEQPANAKPLRLNLHPGCGYDVVVRDAKTRKPITGAKITFGWTDIDREYETNAEGIAKIRQLGISDWYFVIRAKGYATVFKKTSEQKLGYVLPIQFGLDPGAKVVVNLRDEDSNPVVGSRVYLSPDDRSMSPGYSRAKTDNQGQVVVEGLPMGRPLRLHSDKNGYEDAWHRFSIGDGGNPVKLVLTSKQLPYGGDVVVTVLDDASGEPINDAKLINSGSSSSDKRKATTDENGNARVANVFKRYDGHSVVVRADGYVPQRQVFEPGTIKEPSELTVRMVLGKTLRGQVVKPDGKPAAGLRVYYNGGNRMGDLGGRVKTDSKGKFAIHGLPDDTTLTVYTPEKFAPIDELPVPVGEEEPIRIEMEIAGMIRVRAIDADTGEPIPEFNVKVRFCEQRLPDDPRGTGISSSLVNPGVNIQGSKKEYQLGGQLVGMPYKVIVSAKGYETQPVARVVAERADQAELLDVRLDKTRAENLQTVAGRIIDAEGNPIAGASMRLLVGAAVPQPDPRGGKMKGWRFYHWDLLVRDDIENRDMCLQLLKTASDAEGRFEFKNVKAGTPWMELFYFGNDIMSQRYSNLRDRTEEELTKLELSAPKPSQVRVQIDQASFDNAHRAGLEAVDYSRGPNSVKLAYSSENQDIQFVNGKAMLEFKNIPPGDYSVALKAKPVAQESGGFMVRGITSKKIEVTEGSTVTVEF